MKRLIIIAVAGLAIGSTLAQQSETYDRQFEQTMGVDMAQSIARQVTIQRVDLNAMTVQIDGQLYRLPDDGDSPVSDRLGIRPADLRAGGEVFIQTDGTEPSADHRPFIIRMWNE